MQIAEMRLPVGRRSLQAKPSTVQARAAVIAQVRRMRCAGGVLSYQLPVASAKALCTLPAALSVSMHGATWKCCGCLHHHVLNLPTDSPADSTSHPTTNSQEADQEEACSTVDSRASDGLAPDSEMANSKAHDKTDSNAHDQTDSKAAGKAYNKIDDKTDSKAEGKAYNKTDDKTDSKAEGKAYSKTDDKTDSKAEGKANSKTDGRADGETG